MSITEIAKSKIEEEITKGNLPVCLNFLETDDDKSDSLSYYGYPPIYQDEIKGNVDTYFKNYYKPISRLCLEPYTTLNDK